MEFSIDLTNRRFAIRDGERERELPLYSDEAFHELSRLWVRIGWSLKYIYGFTWLGRPIIQLPEDLVRVQEVVYQVKPDVLIETGVAHGGSLVYYASLFRAMGHGRVVGVDVEIRPHNRAAIEAHELFPLITLVEGDSVAPEIVDEVRSLVEPGETVLVVLDSDHSKAHVLAELEAYGPLVTAGSYIIVTDGVMEDVADAPRGEAEWRDDNPVRATEEFLSTHPEFELEDPPPQAFSETLSDVRVTHWPNAYLRRR